jgi:hypothetical protein
MLFRAERAGALLFYILARSTVHLLTPDNAIKGAGLGTYDALSGDPSAEDYGPAIFIVFVGTKFAKLLANFPQPSGATPPRPTGRTC